MVYPKNNIIVTKQEIMDNDGEIPTWPVTMWKNQEYQVFIATIISCFTTFFTGTHFIF